MPPGAATGPQLTLKRFALFVVLFPLVLITSQYSNVLKYVFFSSFFTAFSSA